MPKPLPIVLRTFRDIIREGYNPHRHIYRLGYPNYEVEDAFTKHLVGAFSGVARELTESYTRRLVSASASRWTNGPS